MEPVSKKKPRRLPGRAVWLLALTAALALAVGGALLLRRESPVQETVTFTYGELVAKESGEVASLTITRRDGESYTLLQRSEGTLTLAEDETFVVSDLYAPSLLSAACVISYEDVLAENAADYAAYNDEFGLDQPLTVDVTYTDGSSVRLYVGAKGPLEEDTWYYMTVEGDSRLFALDKSTAENFNVTLSSLHPVTQPTIHQARLDDITFTGADGEILAHWTLAGEITDSDAAASWRMISPWAYPAEEEAMTNLRKNLSNLRLGAYVCEATAENLAQYGLDAPQFILTLHMAAGTTGSVDADGVYATVDWPESTFEMRIGAAKSDAVDYVLVNGMIYLCSHYSLAIFRDMDPRDTLSRYPLMVELEDLAKASGFQITAAVAAVAEHSIVRRFAAGRPDAEDQAVLKRFGQKIQERLQKGETAGHIPGNRPYKKSGGGIVPQTGDACIQCGKCAAQCPAMAIDTADARKIDATKCIGCMRCVKICPQHAKALETSVLNEIESMLEKVCLDYKPCELY